MNRLVAPEEVRERTSAAAGLPSWTLSLRQLCDLELLAHGGFSPLRGFLSRPDYETVLRSMRLADSTLWPIPVTLGVTEAVARAVETNRRLALRDQEGAILAVLDVEDLWRPDRDAEAEAVFGTTNREHPGVTQFFAEEGAVYVGGPVAVIAPPTHYDFPALRHTPAQLRLKFREGGWDRIVAFQTRNPMHRAHFELVRSASEAAEADYILIHPSVGQTREGDVDHYTRVRGYQAVLPRFGGKAALSLLPLAMRMAGPREAVWHALIRQNYGCTDFIVGRDHAGPGADSTGTPFSEPDAAVKLARQVQSDLAIRILLSESLVYVPGVDRYVPEREVPKGAPSASLSGTELRKRLAEGREIPEWFTFPEVAEVLRQAQDPPGGPVMSIWLTGLPASGKSTIARHLVARLMEQGGRAVTLLDGDHLRRTISAGLGFSRADREEHIRRVARLAAKIVKEGGVAVCPVIAPYEAARREARALIELEGRFVLVYVATPLAVCEERDPKGLYAKARAGVVKEFTGISDPYEPPLDAEVMIGVELDAAAAAGRILGAAGFTQDLIDREDEAR